MRLKNQGLPNEPLLSLADLDIKDNRRIRVDTVHQVKGESIDAVLYIPSKKHLKELLTDVSTENGRIDYVAITRAKNMLWIAIPYNSEKDLAPSLISHGFGKI